MQTDQFDYAKIISNLIQKNIEGISKSIYKKGEQKYKERLISTGQAFENYLNTAVLKFNKVKTILYHHRPVPLYDFYVDVHAKCGYDRINTDQIKNLLEYSNCITLFGSGGTGKSTLFKHLFLNTIKDTELIPIFVELKDVDRKEYEKIEDFIYDSLRDLNFTLEKDLFIKSLHSGKYVIFLDAFDEVKESKKSFVSEEIVRLSNQYISNNYFVSSRPNNMLERGWDNFSDFIVEPLNKEKSIKLIENLQYDDELKERFLLQLSEGTLFDTHESFCSNPLLLTIMLLTFEEFAEIPDKLHIFYSRAFDVLYSKHDATKGSFVREKRFEKRGLASDDFENVLSAFSAISYSDSSITFTRDSLIDYIKKARDFTQIDFDVSDFEIDIVEAVCILALEGLEYKYQHRSFQEYFTAKFINNLTDDEQKEFLTILIEENPNSMRDEIFNMLSEMNRVKLEKNFLIPVLNEVREMVNNDVENEANQLKFMQTMYSLVSLRKKIKVKTINGQKVESEEHTPTFRVSHRDGAYNFKYMHVVRFAANKYRTIIEDIPEEFRKRRYLLENKGKYKEIYNRRIDELVEDDFQENHLMLNLKFKDIGEDPKLVEDLLFCCKRHIFDLKFALYVLERLEEKYRNPRSIKGLFAENRRRTGRIK